MVDRTTWLALAERCEKATGPDRGIDVAICEAAAVPDLVRLSSSHVWSPRWTESLDAITALIEREMPGRHWSAIVRDTPLGPRTAEGVICNGELHMSGRRKAVDVFAHTPALALCAVFCRAMAEKQETKP